MGKIIRNEKIITPTQYVEKEVADDKAFLKKYIEGGGRFGYCQYKLDLSGVNAVCPSLLSSMFYYAFSRYDNIELDLSSLDFSKVTSMDYMFQYSQIKNVIFNSLSNPVLTNTRRMFAFADHLASIDLTNFDMSKVTLMEGMFSNASEVISIKLPMSIIKVSGDSGSIFASCRSLIDLDIGGLDFSNATNANFLFSSCRNLETLPMLNTSSVTSANQMFFGCTKLTTIPAYDFSQVTNLGSFVNGCTALTSIHCTGMKVNFNISASTLFTREALLEIINNCATVTTTRILTMGATNLAKLTDEDKLLATNKGWTLA